MFKPKFLLVGAAVLAVGLFGATPSVRADDISLTAGNANIAATGSGPYGTVSITACSSITSGVCTAATSGATGVDLFQITVTSASGYVMGDSSVLALNFSSAAGTISGTDGTGAYTFVSCTYTSGSCTSGALSSAANGTATQVDGWGQFNFVLDDGSGFSPQQLTSFTIDIMTTGTFTNTNLLSSLLTGATKKDGTATYAAAAVHVAPTDNTACTGWAAGGIPGATQPSSQTPTTSSPCVPAPDPSTGGMLAIGLLGVGGFGLIWRRRREDLV